MGRKLQIGVIGLGKFGLAMAEALIQQGHEVMGVDQNQDRVQEVHPQLTSAYRADASDREALRQIGIAELDHVVISVGSSMETSLLAAMHLKDLGSPNLWVKAVNHEHQKLLQMIGVEQVVIPEIYAARFLAKIFD